IAETNIDLYAGEGARAYERVRRCWGDMKRNYLLRVQLIRGEANFFRARCALATLRSLGEGERQGRLAEAARCATRLERERTVWTVPLAHLIRASVAHARGERAEAAAQLAKAIDAAEAADMGLHAAVARYRLG